MGIIKLTERPQELKLDHAPQDAEAVTSQLTGETDYKYSTSAGLLYLPEAAHKMLCDMNLHKNSLVLCSKPGRGKSANAYSFGTTDYWDAHGKQTVPFTDPNDWQTQPVQRPLKGAVASSSGPRRAVQQQQALAQHMRGEHTQQTPAATGLRPGAAQFASALITAIEAVAEAQRYCDSKQLFHRFSADDIRAIAITMWIDAGKQRERGAA